MKCSRLVALVFFSGVLLIASQGFAESPISGFTELRVGGYYPGEIDDEPGLAGEPFAEIFGESSELLFEAEINFYLYQHDLFGKFGVGGSFGRVSFTGPSEIRGDGGTDSTTSQLRQAQSNGEQDGTNNGGDGTDGGGNNSDSEEGVSVQEETSFNVYPVRSSVIYLFDYHVRHWGIPVVPVLRGGVDYHFWNSKDGAGNVSVADGTKGSGGKAGWHAGAGLYFLLDVVDEGSAASLDSTWGLNNSYLYAQYLKSEVDGFGDSGFDLSDDHFTFGLAFEF